MESSTKPTLPSSSLKTFAKQITIDEYKGQTEDYTQKALRELQEQMKTFKRPLIIKKSDKLTDLSDLVNKIDVSHSNNDSNNSNDSNDDSNNDSNDDSNDDSKNDSDEDNQKLKKKIKLSKNNENSTNTNVNLIIKHVVDNDEKNKKTLKTLKTNTKNTKNTANTTTTMTDSIYAQHEIDINKIAELNKTIFELKQTIKNKDREYNDMDGKMHYLKLDLGNSQIEKSDLLKQVELFKKDEIKNTNLIKTMEANNKKYIFYWKIIKKDIVLLYMFNIYFDLVEFLLLF